ncbi:hypothetical protein BaRGS_00015568 [Batillaria attramentaria]|uniref:Uncharacterized protein n=1 Tax=Batillaria attramentaria TaxID=370345 RepID=A0ABD0L1M2_9CAEN
MFEFPQEQGLERTLVAPGCPVHYKVRRRHMPDEMKADRVHTDQTESTRNYTECTYVEPNTKMSSFHEDREVNKETSSGSGVHYEVLRRNLPNETRPVCGLH